MGKTIEVPSRGRKWVRGALVRDGKTLYRVTSAPIRYHEDCLPMQRVARVRAVPEDWRLAQRLVEIMERVARDGTHTPQSRGADGAQPVAEIPAADGPTARWEAREDAASYASYPRLEIRGDVLVYVRPIYDDSPVVTWIRDAEVAHEAADLIDRKPSLSCYPRVRVRGAA